MSKIGVERDKNIRFNFSVDVISGSLKGQQFKGSFSYDPSLLKGKGQETIKVLEAEFDYLSKYSGNPEISFTDGKFEKLIWVAGKSTERFGFNSGFDRNQFGRPEEAFIRNGDDYFGYLDKNTFVDGAGKITYTPIKVELRKVTVYEHANFQGLSRELIPGSYNISNLGIPNDSLSSLKVERGLKVTLYEAADFQGRTKTFTEDAAWVGDDFNDITSSIKVELINESFGQYAGAYCLSTADDPLFLYPLVVEANGDVYLSNQQDKVKYSFDQSINTLTFDWQTIDTIERKGQLTFSKNPDKENACSGSITSRNTGLSDLITGIQILKTQVWATPATSSLPGSIGDHTWVTMADSHCWNVLGGGPGYYCDEKRWKRVGNTSVYFPPEGRLLSSTDSGDPKMANCLGGEKDTFLGIPRYAGIVYGLNGVCHQMANRLLLSAGKLTVSGAKGYTMSCILYGIYGTRNSVQIVAAWFGWALPFVVPLIEIFLAGVNIEFGVRCGNCHAPYPGPMIADQRPRLAHDAILDMSADDFYSSTLDNHHQHLIELRQLFATKAGSFVSEQKIDTILSLYNEMLLPSKDIVEDIFNRIPKSFEGLQGEKRELDATQRVLLADKINEMVNSQQKRVANHLNYSEYVTLFDFDPDQEVVLIDPRIMSMTI